MRRDSPTWLLVCTVACVILVNLVAAVVIVQAFYPGANIRLGLAGLVALSVLAVACGLYTARGWRTYLRRPPSE